MGERLEALMRLVVYIITGIILGLWKILVQLLVIVHWIVVVITGKRSRGIAEFCHLYNCQVFAFLKYMTFATNKRPFPFGELAKVDKVEL